MREKTKADDLLRARILRFIEKMSYGRVNYGIENDWLDQGRTGGLVGVKATEQLTSSAARANMPG
jgi:hypothetical protein